MQSIAREFLPWLLKCLIVGSIPGAVCWIAWFMLGGFSY